MLALFSVAESASFLADYGRSLADSAIFWQIMAESARKLADLSSSLFLLSTVINSYHLLCTLDYTK